MARRDEEPWTPEAAGEDPYYMHAAFRGLDPWEDIDEGDD